MEYIEITHLHKMYHVGDIEINAIQDVTFSIEKGKFVVIVGASGAGKTTLLNILGGMDQASAGTFFLDYQAVTQFNERELTTFRRKDIGFVFQFYNLIPNLTALENVEIATQVVNDGKDAKEMLIQVGLENRLDNFPSQLSGGEQQRVSIARALAKNPKLLLCDEPTGALDYETGKTILNLLHSTAKKQHMTAIVITHNAAIAPIADVVIHMKNGEVTDVIHNTHPTSVEEIEW